VYFWLINFSARDEVFPVFGLVKSFLQMPILAVFATAADVSDCEYAPRCTGDQFGIKEWIERDAVSPYPSKEPD